MTMRLGSRQFGWKFRLVRLLFTSALFIASNAPSWALAQTTEDPWAVPLNLSHSGVAINPDIVIDSEAVVHAVWQDEMANLVYTRLDGDQWRAPKTTDLNRLFRMPTESERARSESTVYTGPNPLFIAGPGPYIFAFWLTPEGKLFTSKVTNQNFEHFSAWDVGGIIASQAASFTVAVDARGEWHLAYFRTVDDPRAPAGLYYTHSRNSGWNWAIPELLYESPYLRRLDEGEANLSLTTAGADDSVRVYIAWDNRPRKQVLLAQSTDAGRSWEQPVLVAGPAPDSEDGPFNIHVGANHDSIVLVWQSGRPGGGCSQLFQSSRDGGATWSEPQPMIEDLLGCTQSNGFVITPVSSPDGLTYFLTESQSEIYLSAWNGRRWSEPQEQPALAGFEDPEVFTQVDYGCHRASLLGERLYIVGCDQSGGGDVWVTSRDLGSDTSWFSSPVWSQPSPVTDDTLETEAVELVTTEDDVIHAFFSQHQDPVIYYTSWNGELWSSITPVLRLPDGEAGWPAIAAGPGNELFLIARNNRGGIYFSRATSESAVIASNWSTPTLLGIAHDGEVGSVDLARDSSGTVYVAYSVPVNEQRGIYLVQSKDDGATWTEPLKVFDGAAAGFDLVGTPSLLISANGFLHVIWKEQSIQGDGVTEPLSLYYARSQDGGHSFTDAEMVVEEPVAWREIAADGNGNLHLLWQPQGTPTTVWDQVSMDGGHTWQYPQGLPDQGRLAAVARDPAGRLHLVGVGPVALGHWHWDGSRWHSEAPPVWTLSSQSPVELLAAAVNKQGKMMIVLEEPTGEGEAAESTLFYSTRTLDLPTEQTAVTEVPTATLLSPTITAATDTPEHLLIPTASVDNQAVNQGQVDSAESNNPITPFTMALIPVAVILLSVLAIVIRRAARAKGR